MSLSVHPAPLNEDTRTPAMPHTGGAASGEEFLEFERPGRGCFQPTLALGLQGRVERQEQAEGTFQGRG